MALSRMRRATSLGDSIRLVVFDLAGTTVDDQGGMVLRCLMEAVREHDLPGSADELNALMGMNKEEVLDLLAIRRYGEASPLTREVASTALATFRKKMRAAYQDKVRPVDGAEETFTFLRARNVRIATDTGFDAEVTEVIMGELNWPGRLIDLSVCSSDVARGRPAPYMIFHAMEKLDVMDVREVMKVGDSPSDLEEGFNAGCGEVIGVLSGAHTAETLDQYPHTHLLPSVAELPALFASS